MENILYSEKITNYGLSYIELYNVNHFETKHIFECGQCFRWNLLEGSENTYIGVVNGKVCAVSTEIINGEKVICISNTNKIEFEEFWKNYFDLCEDYEEMYNGFSSKDSHLKAATQYGNGIRILHQDFFETLISFILSANNNIPRIKGCIEKLCRKYGKKIKVVPEFFTYLSEKSNKKIEQEAFYAFPSAKQLENVSAQDYSETCKAGYRCAYLEKTVKDYLANPDFYLNLSNKDLTLEEAEKLLQKYNGVGPKVADCILLFSGIRKDAFPIDVWVKRVLSDLYLKREASTKEIRGFIKEYFGENAGYAQQYLFYYMREIGDSYDND